MKYLKEGEEIIPATQDFKPVKTDKSKAKKLKPDEADKAKSKK